MRDVTTMTYTELTLEKRAIKAPIIAYQRATYRGPGLVNLSEEGRRAKRAELKETLRLMGFPSVAAARRRIREIADEQQHRKSPSLIKRTLLGSSLQPGDPYVKRGGCVGTVISTDGRVGTVLYLPRREGSQ